LPFALERQRIKETKHEVKSAEETTDSNPSHRNTEKLQQGHKQEDFDGFFHGGEHLYAEEMAEVIYVNPVNPNCQRVLMGEGNSLRPRLLANRRLLQGQRIAGNL